MNSDKTYLLHKVKAVMKSDMKTWIRNYFDVGFYLRSNALFHLLTPNMIMFMSPATEIVILITIYIVRNILVKTKVRAFKCILLPTNTFCSKQFMYTYLSYNQHFFK